MYFEVTSAGTFTGKEKRTQFPWSDFLVLSITGLVGNHLYFPSGKRVCDGGQPTLALYPKGFRLDFEYDHRRENHVIIGKIHGLSWSEENSFLEISDHGLRVQLPYIRLLTHEQCAELRPRFERVEMLVNSGLPADLFAARQHAAALLTELISAPRPVKSEESTAAAAFRSAIDSDGNFRKTLSQLSRESGYSPGHLRRLFVEQYHIEPGEYRARRRLNRIMELFRENRLSPKEIAEAVGMHHVTHLHAFLRERLGMTPRELRGGGTAAGTAYSRDPSR